MADFVAEITTALSGFITSMSPAVAAALGIGAACLAVWIGFRLAAKLANRGTGK